MIGLAVLNDVCRLIFFWGGAKNKFGEEAAVQSTVGNSQRYRNYAVNI